MNYLKAIAAAIVAGAATAATALDSGGITHVEWCYIALAVFGSSGVVWYVENGPGGMYAKEFFAGLTAGTSSLLLAFQDNIVTTQELITVAIAVAVGLGLVAKVPGPTKSLAASPTKTE